MMRFCQVFDALGFSQPVCTVNKFLGLKFNPQTQTCLLVYISTYFPPCSFSCSYSCSLTYLPSRVKPVRTHARVQKN